MQVDPSKQMRLGFITGLVAKAKAATFERILFRATRGNMFLKQAELEEAVIDPATGDHVRRPPVLHCSSHVVCLFFIRKPKGLFPPPREHVPEAGGAGGGCNSTLPPETM